MARVWFRVACQQETTDDCGNVPSLRLHTGVHHTLAQSDGDSFNQARRPYRIDVGHLNVSTCIDRRTSLRRCGIQSRVILVVEWALVIVIHNHCLHVAVSRHGVSCCDTLLRELSVFRLFFFSGGIFPIAITIGFFLRTYSL
jgi:hypothetical protein